MLLECSFTGAQYLGMSRLINSRRVIGNRPVTAGVPALDSHNRGVIGCRVRAADQEFRNSWIIFADQPGTVVRKAFLKRLSIIWQKPVKQLRTLARSIELSRIAGSAAWEWWLGDLRWPNRRSLE